MTVPATWVPYIMITAVYLGGLLGIAAGFVVIDWIERIQEWVKWRRFDRRHTARKP